MGEGYVVYGAPWCSYCKMAVQLLEETGQSYTYYDITEGDHLTELQSRLPDGVHYTIPRIFHEGRLVGGYDRLTEELNHAN